MVARGDLGAELPVEEVSCDWSCFDESKECVSRMTMLRQLAFGVMVAAGWLVEAAAAGAWPAGPQHSQCTACL